MQPRSMRDTEKSQVVCECIPANQHPRLPTLRQYPEDNNNTVNDKRPCSDHHMQKSGLLFIQINSQKKIAARAKVYKTILDHYMVLSSKSVTNNKQRCINLKNTHVERVGKDCIRVTPTKDIDGQSMLIVISHEGEVDSWLEALTATLASSPTLSHCVTQMPTLTESDEEVS
ncbi:uncharacterized protein [Watersipora subatra]|uniref:uncharacterized protein n=1 Tax=Watersipora subatra TaxID=2589382 RepID=UPI00355AE4D8